MAVIVYFVFLWMFTGVVSQKEIQPSYQQVCLPFNAHIIWDQSKEEGSFAIQLHYVLQVINSAPEGTHIRLDTVDEKLRNAIDTIKVNDQTKDLSGRITIIPRRISEHNVIPYNVLKEAISNNFKKNEASAEEIFFIVHDKSVIDDEENAIKYLSRRKVFVVFHGTESPISKFWTKLATDKQHVLKPNKNTDENVDAFLNLLCRDSILFCDTDKYWNGTGCFRCSFICSQKPSEYCQHECPYFDRLTWDVDKLDELPASHGFICNDTSIFLAVILIHLIVILILQCTLVFKVDLPSQLSNLLKYIRNLNKRTEVPLNNVEIHVNGEATVNNPTEHDQLMPINGNGGKAAEDGEQPRRRSPNHSFTEHTPSN